MILSSEDVRSIIKNNPNKLLISDKRTRAKLLRMHVTGKDIQDFVYSMPYFEREELKKERVKMMRSNKDLLARVMRPMDKIFTAKGGFEQYTMTPETLEANYRQYLAEMAQGLPMKEWIRQVVLKNLLYNPDGLIFIEVDEYGRPYPTVKSINEIYDYELYGRQPEYVVFEISQKQISIYQQAGLLPDAKNLRKGVKVFRVVCDLYDRLVIKGNGSTQPDDIDIYQEIDNPFMPKVPAIIISDIWSDDVDVFSSPIEDAVELLNAYMFAGSTFNIAYARQAYPKEWMQVFPCPTCHGHKEVAADKCPECKGQGVLVSMKAADVLLVDFTGAGGEKIPNPPMGHVNTPVDGLEFMRENQEMLADKIDYSIWGVSKVTSYGRNTIKPAGKGGNVSNTAYEAQLNEQPKHDRLKLFSLWASGIMTFIADKCGSFIYPNQYRGAAIVLGDRYMIESPDATWDRYTKAVAAKAPMATLDSLLIEYIENKYNSNPLLYRKYNLLIQVEPFVHESVDVIWADNTLPLVARLEKKYFDEWTSTLTDYDVAMVGDNGADKLREMLRKYVTGKYIEQKQAETLLFTATDGILNIGDTVQIKNGMEQTPEHKGKTFEIKDINGQDLTLRSSGKVYQGYQINDVTKSVITQTA
jgi:hypothetical protein